MQNDEGNSKGNMGLKVEAGIYLFRLKLFEHFKLEKALVGSSDLNWEDPHVSLSHLTLVSES